MFDANRAHLHTGQTSRAGPKRFRLNYGSDNPMVLVAGSAVSQLPPTPQSRVGVLSEVQDEVPRGKWPAAGAGGAGDVAAPALGAGIQVQQLFPREISQRFIGHSVAVSSDRGQAFTRERVSE